jgi:hypothetical protein
MRFSLDILPKFGVYFGVWRQPDPSRRAPGEQKENNMETNKNERGTFEKWVGAREEKIAAELAANRASAAEARAWRKWLAARDARDNVSVPA